MAARTAALKAGARRLVGRMRGMKLSAKAKRRLAIGAGVTGYLGAFGGANYGLYRYGRKRGAKRTKVLGKSKRITRLMLTPPAYELGYRKSAREKGLFR